MDSEERRQRLAEADQAATDAQAVVEAVKRRHDAERLHETAARYGEVADALGPEGVRQRLLDSGLARLNAGMAVLSEVSGWPAVVMSPDGSVSIGGRPGVLCSESERWRAQAAIQLTLAPLTGSRAVVLDRADLLDMDNSEGLEEVAVQRVSEKVPIAVVLCSTGEPFDDRSPRGGRYRRPTSAGRTRDGVRFVVTDGELTIEDHAQPGLGFSPWNEASE